MGKDNFLHIANNIYQEALSANSYWNILQQFQKNIQQYPEEMKCSPAFYNTVRQALLESLFMNLARIYDKDNRSLTIRNLLKEAESITEVDFEEKMLEIYNFCNGHFQHTIKPVEEPFFKKEVEEQRQICNCLEIEYRHTNVNLTYQELLELYQKRLHGLNKSISNLIQQRNKIYAHNDKQTNFEVNSIVQDNPIFPDDVNALIELALDFSCFCIGVTTGIAKAREYVNINDWEGTLKLVNIGMEFREECIERMMNESL